MLSIMNLDDLNPEQRDAVTHVEGPLLVLAGAGSGKTRVITRRVAHLIEHGISPRNILAITFTNKASGEMKDRIEQLVPGSKVWVSTFHKFCARLLRIHGDRVGLREGYVIYDTADRMKVIRDSLAKLELDKAHWKPEQVENAISRAKNELLDAVAYSERASDYFQLNIAKVYRVYQEQLLQSNAVDFDDLLLHVAIMLRDQPELRAELDERYRFILVDEYQDTNLAQYAILRGLAVDHPNLCATGDPDQSIYGWRGANIRNILQFEEDFPGTRVVRLEKNYRSTKRILEAASHLIRFNRRRKPKDLVTDNPDGRPVRVDQFSDEQEESRSIAARVRDAVDAGQRDYRDCAVFCRTAALTRNLEMALAAEHVPYQVLSGVAFFERAEVKDLLAYLKLLVNPRDDVAFARVVNVPARGIGKSSIDRLQTEAARLGLPLLESARQLAPPHVPAATHDSPLTTHSFLKSRQADALACFVRLIDALATLKSHCVAEIMRQVLERTDYFGDAAESYKKNARAARKNKKSIEPADESDNDPDSFIDERRENVEELLTAAHQFDVANPGGTLDQFLSESVLATDLDDWDESRSAVSLMTLHAAKGLEFPVIFIVAIEHNILPHSRSLANGDDLEEERRLLFVGMTRAKQELNLSHVRVREYRGQTQLAIPSQFLTELPINSGVTMSDDTESNSSPRFRRSEFRRAGTNAGNHRGYDESRSGTRPDRPAASRAMLMTAAELVGESPAPPADAAEFQQGLLVRHPAYGLGRITALSGYGTARKATIRFTAGDTRTFVLSRSPLRAVKV